MFLRLTRTQAANYIGCSLSLFDKLQREGYLEGTYFSLYGRRYYIKDKIDSFLNSGGTYKGADYTGKTN